MLPSSTRPATPSPTPPPCNLGYGAKIVVPGAGFLLNNEMDDFSSKADTANSFGLIGREANAIAPRKRMLSSMTPTILLREGEPVLVTGSPGGSTIITTVLQVMVNVIDHDMDLATAVAAPRLHHQWRPDRVVFEAESAVAGDASGAGAQRPRQPSGNRLSASATPTR